MRSFVRACARALNDTFRYFDRHLTLASAASVPQERLARKRSELSEREIQRWNGMEKEFHRQVKRDEALQDSTAAQRNASSVNYNVLTLNYNKSHSGQLLKYEDDIIRYRATLRGQALEQKMSSVQYDLLTGAEKVERVKVDRKPERPTLDNAGKG